MIIAVSDLHLGTDACNKDEFLRFLRDPLWANDTDLVLCGDIFDFWRGSIADVLVKNADVISELQYMYDELDVGITFIAGNHDWILRKMLHPCFKFSTFHQVEEGRTKYTFIHGWESDPIQRRELFDALCYTSNDCDVSDFIDRVWKAYARRMGLLSRIHERLRQIRTKYEIKDMTLPPHERDLGFLFTQDLPVTREMGSAATVCGHSHIPYIEDNVINCGSWCDVDNTYAMITGSTATVKVFK